MAAVDLSTSEVTRTICNDLVKRIKKFYFTKVHNDFYTMVIDNIYHDDDLIVISMKVSPSLDNRIIEIVEKALSEPEVEKLLPHFHNKFSLFYNTDKFMVQTKYEVNMDLLTINVFVTED